MPLNKEQLIEILRHPENERIELTSSTNNVKKFSQAVCAFANDIHNTQLPGYLLIGVDNDGKVRIDNFPHANDYRNPILAEAMKVLGYVNRFGRGIHTVNKYLVENGNGEAVFKLEDFTSFKVIVHNADFSDGTVFDTNGVENGTNINKNGTDDAVNGINNATYGTDNILNGTDEPSKSVNKKRNKADAIELTNKAIIAELMAYPNISMIKLSEKLQISLRTLARYIAKLKTNCRIERVGTAKAGYWKVLNDGNRRG